MAKTPDTFVRQYTGRAINADGAYGVQCVDGFRVFCNWAFGYSWPTGNGWADGYWYNRAAHSNVFTPVDKHHLKNGDWVVWAKGSGSHPSSHTAMYYNGRAFGQNQGGNRGFCLRPTNFGDCLGGLRWKGWQTAAPKPATKPSASKQVKAKGVARSGPSKAIARTYTTTANLNLRDDANTSSKVLVVIPKGTKFTCYGYFTGSFYYGIATVGSTTYTGFAHKAYLK